MAELWPRKSKQGNRLHQICPYHGKFPQQLPAYYLDMYADAEVILDPFSGCGTTVLEATLRNKFVYGADVSPLACLLSYVKLHCPTKATVLAEIEALQLSGPAPEPPDDLRPFYHPETWRQLWCLREHPKSVALTAVAVGKLHGHSKGFLSCYTYNVFSVPAASLRRAQVKHGTVPEFRDVKTALSTAAKHFLPEQPIEGRGYVLQASAECLQLPDACVDLIITSPPFLNVINYTEANWIRLWFLKQGQLEQAFYSSVPAYQEFLGRALFEMHRLLKPGGRAIVEVGPIKKMRDLHNCVVDARGALEIERLDVNEFSSEDGKSVPKISRANNKGKETTTTSNVCVVMRKL